MDNNTGSFGSAIGGMSPELQAAVNRRAGGNPGGAMAQVSQSAPTYNPTTQSPQPNSVPAPASNTSGLTSFMQPAGTGAGLNPTSDTTIILKAMAEKLKSLSKIEETQGGVV